MASKFPGQLKWLRENVNLTQSQLGKLINSTDVTISRYEAGTREPDLETLEQFANIFNVSADFILGREHKISNQSSATKLPDIWYELTEEEQKEVVNFMYFTKAKRGMTRDDAPNKALGI